VSDDINYNTRISGSNVWSIKTKAFLHDPPHKIPVIWMLNKNHGEVSSELMKILALGTEIPKTIHEADQIASSASRVVLKKLKEPKIGRNIKETKKVRFIDPFTLNECDFEVSDPEKLDREVKQRIKECAGLTDDMRMRFLLLWRVLPELLLEDGIRIFDFPADTRVPNHSLHSHLSQCSAIASALPSPAFLLFTAGTYQGIQGFIQTTRKTSDLWGASYILSYLTW